MTMDLTLVSRASRTFAIELALALEPKLNRVSELDSNRSWTPATWVRMRVVAAVLRRAFVRERLVETDIVGAHAVDTVRDANDQM